MGVSRKAQAFSNFVELDEEDLNEDDRMKRIAEKLQKKFEEENKVSAICSSCKWFTAVVKNLPISV